MSKMFFNMRWALWVVVFTILILLGVWTIEEDIGISIAIILTGVLLLLGIFLVFPSSFHIDSKGVTIYFAVVFRIFAKWNEVRVIEDHNSKAFPWLREYHIGYFKTSFPLWEKVCIPKNKKTTALIEKYYKNTIDKYG